MTRAATERLPLHVLTGFLGSGKTTLLRRILIDPAFSDSAVIINELGEIGLDHELVSFSSDRTVVMPGGCVCCTIREDIEQTLRELFDARDQGRVAPFRRLFIETTGIAHPQPLVFTLHSSPIAASRLLRPKVTTLVDGVLGTSTLLAHEEAVAQVVAADSVVISKSDLAETESLRTLVASLNPWVIAQSANLLKDDLTTVLEQIWSDGALGLEAHSRPVGLAGPAANAHPEVSTSSLVLDQLLDWNAFGVWMSMLLHCHGQRVLRLKAMLHVEGSVGPVSFQCAQHLVHPPEHLAGWEGIDRRSRLVFIVRGLDVHLLERSLQSFDRAAKMAQPAATIDSYLPAGAGGTVTGRPVRRATAPLWMKG